MKSVRINAVRLQEDKYALQQQKLQQQISSNLRLFLQTIRIAFPRDC